MKVNIANLVVYIIIDVLLSRELGCLLSNFSHSTNFKKNIYTAISINSILILSLLLVIS